jgi:hypothetical protein
MVDTAPSNKRETQTETILTSRILAAATYQLKQLLESEAASLAANPIPH